MGDAVDLCEEHGEVAGLPPGARSLATSGGNVAMACGDRLTVVPVAAAVDEAALTSQLPPGVIEFRVGDGRGFLVEAVLPLHLPLAVLPGDPAGPLVAPVGVDMGWRLCVGDPLGGPAPVPLLLPGATLPRVGLETDGGDATNAVCCSSLPLSELARGCRTPLLRSKRPV